MVTTGLSEIGEMEAQVARRTRARELDLNQEVAKMVTGLRRWVDPQAVVSMRLSNGPIWVRARAGEVDQLIVNLTNYALSVFPGGARLTIYAVAGLMNGLPYAGLRFRALPWDRRRAAPDGTEGGREGRNGDSEELNLRMAGQILRGMKGRLEIAPGFQNVLEMEAILPRVADPSTETEKDGAEALPGGGKAILVVDDEPAIRRLLVDVLKSEGYRIESVAAAELALRILEDDPDIQLVLTDMVMEGMGGPELVEHLVHNRPELKVVCMSGTVQNESVHRLLERNRIPLIPKPFRPSEVVQRVRMALGDL